VANENQNEILIVEDDEDIAELMALAFQKEGWASFKAAKAEDALTALGQHKFAFCVLDLMLPGMDGLSFLRVVRSMSLYRNLPIIIASAKDDESDIVAGLSLGADDYIVKPFSPRVLVARIKAVLRRNARDANHDTAQDTLSFKDLVVDRKRHEAKLADRILDLSATEFAILETFLQEPGRVFTREQLIDRTKGHDYPVTDRAIDVHIVSIRRKLGQASDMLETIRGIGYRLKDET